MEIRASGKSAFAYDMAVSLVNGTPWCNRVVQQCRVVWIAAEGAGGHRNRTEALDKEHGLDRARLLTLLDAPDLLDPEQMKGKRVGVAPCRARIFTGGA